MASGKKSIHWYFPSTNHGEVIGFNDAQLEFFEGDHEKYIARETIQNAVDARRDYEKPVRVVFELQKVPTAIIPGLEALRQTMQRCLEFIKGGKQDKAEKFYKNAITLLKGKVVPVLVIRDFNTVGLSGSDDDRNGNWNRLVKATGVSSSKGVGGGSFGIGKGAPIMASALRTVFYSSINDEGKPVFQGKARLISHQDKDGDIKNGVGFYGMDGYNAIRETSKIPDFFTRTEQGTDIFVFGYRLEQDWESKLIRSVLGNFWLAILEGELEVEIKDSSEKIISADTLADYLDKYDSENAKSYFDAYTDYNESFATEIKHVGKVIFSVKKSDGYPSKVMMARKPKMFVQDKSYRELRDQYAGVFVCIDDRGNDLLKELEPPSHDAWKKDKKADNIKGASIWYEIDSFIKEKLKGMNEVISGEAQDIPELDRYLPDSEDREVLQRAGMLADPTSFFTDEETGREIGGVREPMLAGIETVTRRGIITNKEAGFVTKTPPKGTNKDKRGRPTGPEKGADEGIRINTSDISFRSFVQKKGTSLLYHFAITGKQDCNGALRLVAIGDDSSYPIDIQSAVDLDTKMPYENQGSLIKDLDIAKGQTLRLGVQLVASKKYALGIENYAS